VAYSQVSDLLTGGIPLPSTLSAQKYVDDAADEIDSQIGHVFVTPIDATDAPGNPVVRPVRLLLKRISNYLATGRLIMAVSSNDEDDRLHAYGLSLVQEATGSLMAIASGQIPLDGVEFVNPDTARVTAPMIYNEDPESSVEAFYNRIANPRYTYFPIERTHYVDPDGLVM
jgi:hypothetical protein